MDHDTYLKALRNRLIADGCTVRDESLGSVAAIAGYPAQPQPDPPALGS